jgi:NADPH:quinone reductase-like Zn-dependent oxidoreductase
MPSNTAAWLTAAKATPLEVKEAPYTSPGENEILIKNGAVAINPVDWALQARGNALFPWVQYPTTLGEDVAGQVVEVGNGVSRFKIGDRVLGMATGMTPENPKNSELAFQAYTILQSNMAAQIPSTLSYESACVIPMGYLSQRVACFRKTCWHLSIPLSIQSLKARQF